MFTCCQARHVSTSDMFSGQGIGVHTQTGSTALRKLWECYEGVTTHDVGVVQIVVASTDFDGKQSEKRNITAVAGPTPEGLFLLALDRPLEYMHWGDYVPTGLPGIGMLQVIFCVLSSFG
jgi:hypothetical protein